MARAKAPWKVDSPHPAGRCPPPASNSRRPIGTSAPSATVAGAEDEGGPAPPAQTQRPRGPEVRVDGRHRAAPAQGEGGDQGREGQEHQRRRRRDGASRGLPQAPGGEDLVGVDAELRPDGGHEVRQREVVDREHEGQARSAQGRREDQGQLHGQDRAPAADHQRRLLAPRVDTLGRAAGEQRDQGCGAQAEQQDRHRHAAQVDDHGPRHRQDDGGQEQGDQAEGDAAIRRRRRRFAR